MNHPVKESGKYFSKSISLLKQELQTFTDKWSPSKIVGGITTDHHCMLEYSINFSCKLSVAEKNKLNLKHQRSQDIRTKMFHNFYMLYMKKKSDSQIFHIQPMVILHQPSPPQMKNSQNKRINHFLESDVTILLDTGVKVVT